MCYFWNLRRRPYVWAYSVRSHCSMCVFIGVRSKLYASFPCIDSSWYECPSKRIDLQGEPTHPFVPPTIHPPFISIGVTRTNIGSRRFFWGHKIDMVHSSIVSHHYLRRWVLSKYRLRNITHLETHDCPMAIMIEIFGLIDANMSQ